MPAAVVPPPGKAASRTATRIPSTARASAHAAPTIPAPTTIASKARGVMRPQPERVPGIESERRFSRHERGAAHVRHERFAAGGEPSLEQAADDALLPPDLAERE